jgi:hypothetical protein
VIGEEDEETSRVAVGSYEEANEDSELEVLRRFPSLSYITRSTPRRDDHHIGSLAFFLRRKEENDSPGENKEERTMARVRKRRTRMAASPSPSDPR